MHFHFASFDLCLPFRSNNEDDEHKSWYHYDPIEAKDRLEHFEGNDQEVFSDNEEMEMEQDLQIFDTFVIFVKVLVGLWNNKNPLRPESVCANVCLSIFDYTYTM